MSKLFSIQRSGLALFLLLFFSVAAFSQGQGSAASADKTQIKAPGYKLPDPTPYANGITAADLKVLLDSLASDYMQGRETGEEGQRIAADYIAAQFEALDLPPMGGRRSYFQKIQLERTNWDDLEVSIKGETFKSRKDYYVFHAYNKSEAMIKPKNFVFVGYGIEEGNYSDYAGVDVAGKAVIFYSGEPVSADGMSRITNSVNRSNWSIDWRKKLQLAKEKGATLAIIIDTRFEENVKSYRRLISTYGWQTVGSDSASTETNSIHSVFVSEELGAKILGSRDKKVESTIESIKNGGASKSIKVKSDLEIHMVKSAKRLEGSNVIGFIEGTDPKKKNEYVFLTAHYDHLGVKDGQVFNGADDNASGTSGIIEIARAFAAAKKAGVGPKRSVVCMLVSGEEKGLLGSRFYTDFPIFSMKNTVADINIDMIGRVDDDHKGNPDYIYVIGSDRLSTQLDNTTRYMNDKYTKLDLDYKYNDPKDPNHYYERSDHYNFAKNDIPVVFFFNGTHADYHRASDTREKINFDALAKRAQLAFLVAWDLANRPERIRVDVTPEKEEDKD
ncbi:MAG: M28 family peptidase [Saprospiraceae bacterium]